jgi:hypothetical protein
MCFNSLGGKTFTEIAHIPQDYPENKLHSNTEIAYS